MGFLDFILGNTNNEKLIIFLAMMARVAKEDGKISDGEYAHIGNFIDRLNLTKTQRAELNKKINAIPINEAVQKSQKLTEKEKNELFDELILVAKSDGEMTSDELTLIIRMSQAMGLDINAVKQKLTINNFKIDDDMPSSIDTDNDDLKMFKRDITGLMAYFKKLPNMERLFNELTYAIRNGMSVEEYIKNANVLDNEIRPIVAREFNNVAGFLKDMLKIEHNPELEKDYNACLELIKLLNNN